ncbi:MAG: rhamnulose-1-phosphate aldolase [Bacteroidota bacterium]|nr:rhamnulose-1-phosphate aldolase [Bacteroidota bacterium]
MKNAILKNPEVKKLIFEVAELAEYLWQKGWAERNAGNISVNINHLIPKDLDDLENYPLFPLSETYPELAGSYFFVTGTGKRMRDLAKNPLKNAALIRISERGNQYHIISQNEKNTASFRPTSELPSHLAIHQLMAQRKSPYKVIIHTHPNELVALSQSPIYKQEDTLNKILWGMHPETYIVVPKGVGVVPYHTPGTEEIAKATLEKLDKHDVVLWEKHGVFAVGENVFDTFDMIDTLSKSAQIFFICKNAGYEPEGLTDEQLLDLKNQFHIQ